eukprot:scaffold83031_cov44-Phaeocystis_antarctica.AAC.2
MASHSQDGAPIEFETPRRHRSDSRHVRLHPVAPRPGHGALDSAERAGPAAQLLHLPGQEARGDDHLPPRLLGERHAL